MAETFDFDGLFEKAVQIWDRPARLWRIARMLLGLAVVLILIPGFFWTLYSEGRIAREGASTRGRVVSVEEGCGGKCQLVSVSFRAGRTPHIVDVETSPGTELAAGDSVPVSYDRGDPEQAQIPGQTRSRAGAFLTVIGVFVVGLVASHVVVKRTGALG